MEKPYSLKKSDDSLVYVCKKDVPILACVSKDQANEIMNLLNDAYRYGKITGEYNEIKEYHGKEIHNLK